MTNTDYSRRALCVLFLALFAATRPCLADPPMHWDQSSNGTAGPTVEGFAVSLTSDAATVKVGAPIWVTLEVKNVSGQVQTVGGLGSRHYCCQFTITNVKTGSVVPSDPDNPFGMGDLIMGPLCGRPHAASQSLYAKFRLDVLYRFTEPGTYTVQATRVQLARDCKPVVLHSGTITITILP